MFENFRKINPSQKWCHLNIFLTLQILHIMNTNSFRDRENRQRENFRVIYDFAMGIIWFGAGVFFLLNKYLGNNLGFDSLLSSIFGISCICYGAFRFYRGYASKRK